MTTTTTNEPATPTDLALRAIGRMVPAQLDAATVLSVLRSFVGTASWAGPALSWRTFGLGPMDGSPSAALMTRLFGVRDLALGLAVRHPNPETQRAALQIGVAVDAVDLLAGSLAFRRGAPKASLVGVGCGAAVFVGLGLTALADRHHAHTG